MFLSITVEGSEIACDEAIPSIEKLIKILKMDFILYNREV